MILYIEKQARDYKQTKVIIDKFKKSSIVWIDNYKNIFDKNIGFSSEKSIIIAKLLSNPITKAPPGYGYNTDSYFFKTSLNCIFDCKYCYLKGAFKNDMMVYFVNYEDIKESIKSKVYSPNPSPSPLQEEGNKEILSPEGGKYPRHEGDWGKKEIRFYSSDYSDILGMDKLSNFIQEFVPFFEKLKLPSPSGEGLGVRTMMEIRTKSADISSLLNLGFVPKNTEVAFSLNPESLIEKYETGTSSLDSRIEAINVLLDKGFKVGLRFLPLLPVKNYKEIYIEFLEYIEEKIDLHSIYSTFITGLLFTKSDYNKMLKKYPDLDVLYMLEMDNDGFARESKKLREDFYGIFKKYYKQDCRLCLEN